MQVHNLWAVVRDFLAEQSRGEPYFDDGRNGHTSIPFHELNFPDQLFSSLCIANDLLNKLLLLVETMGWKGLHRILAKQIFHTGLWYQAV